MRILFPWKARIQENSEGSQSHFGRFPAFFRNLFPFSRFFASFFCMKREQNSDNRRKTPRTLLQEAKIQVRIGFKGEQILKKSRKTPGGFRISPKDKEAGRFQDFPKRQRSRKLLPTAAVRHPGKMIFRHFSVSGDELYWQTVVGVGNC